MGGLVLIGKEKSLVCEPGCKGGGKKKEEVEEKKSGAGKEVKRKIGRGKKKNRAGNILFISPLSTGFPGLGQKICLQGRSRKRVGKAVPVGGNDRSGSLKPLPSHVRERRGRPQRYIRRALAGRLHLPHNSWLVRGISVAVCSQPFENRVGDTKRKESKVSNSSVQLSACFG